MTPVDQSKLYRPDAAHRGNCFPAALASLLDVPLWMVPPFEEMRAEVWEPRTQEWLHRCFGLQLVREFPEDNRLLPEFYIASGYSPRGVRHSVIYSRGALVHDPHPSRAGIQAVEWTWHLAPVEAQS